MAETENTSIINMVETENTSASSEKTQLINLRGLNTFLDESIKIFEPTLPEGTDGQVLKLSGGKPSWEVSNEFDEIRAKDVFTSNISSGLVESDRVKIGEQTEASQLELTADRILIKDQQQLTANRILVKEQLTADRILIKEQQENKTLRLTPSEVSAKFIYLDGDIPKYKIGDVGPGGGIVFYDAGKTITSSYLDSSGSEVKYTWRYLEVSPRLSITMPDGSTSSTIPWGVNWNSSSGWLWGDSAVEGLKADIGTGRYNTTKAVNQLGTSFNSHYYSSPMTADKLTGPGNYAPCVCYNYRGGGFSDWYLPSIQELAKIYTNAATPGYVSENGWLWSSSVFSSTNCWGLLFSVPYVDGHNRYNRNYVRAVRGFTS